MRRLWKWLTTKVERALVDEYLVELWFAPKSVTQPDGTVQMVRTKKQFTLGKVIEISQTHIKGKTTFGGRFELRTTEVFDYNIIQTK